MPEYVRVKDPISRGEYTTSAENAKGSELPVIKKPAVDQLGVPLPAKPNVGANPGAANKAEANAKAKGLEATTEEES